MKIQKSWKTNRGIETSYVAFAKVMGRDAGYEVRFGPWGPSTNGKVMNLPSLPLFLTEKDLKVMRSHIFHEVGHKLVTDFPYFTAFGQKHGRASQSLLNSIEDVRQEIVMARRNRGGEAIIRNSNAIMAENGQVKTGEKSAAEALQTFAYMYGCLLRGWDECLEPVNVALAALKGFLGCTDKLLNDAKRLLSNGYPTLTNTQDAGELTLALTKLFQDEADQSQESSQEESESGEQSDEQDDTSDSEDSSKGDEAEQEEGDSEPSEDDKSDEGEEGDSSKDESQDGESEDGDSASNEADENGDDESEGDSENGDEKGDSSENESQDGESEDDATSNEAGEGDDESESGESEGDEKGDSSENESQDGESEDDATSNEAGEGDDESESGESEGDEEGDSSENESQDGKSEGDDSASNEADENGEGESEGDSENGEPSEKADPKMAQAVEDMLAEDTDGSEVVDYGQAIEDLRQEIAAGERPEYKDVPMAPCTEADGVEGSVTVTGDKAGYNAVAQNIGRKSGVLLQQLKMLLATQVEEDIEFSRRGKLNARRLWRTGMDDDMVFSRTTDIEETRAPVSTLIDLSGSMMGEPIELAMQSLALLESAMSQIGNPTEYLGFGDRDDHAVTVIKRFEEDSMVAKARIGGLKSHVGGCTPLMDCLMEGYLRLLQREEKDRVMFIITDGQPSRADECRDMIDAAGNSGITTVVFLIGITSVPDWLKGANAQCIRNVNDLSTAILDCAKQLLT